MTPSCSISFVGDASFGVAILALVSTKNNHLDE